LGKTTLINTLFSTELSPPKNYSRRHVKQLDKLTATAVENEKVLRRVHRATDRVLGIIARAIREQRTATTGYTKTNLPTRRGTGALGLTLDRRF